MYNRYSSSNMSSPLLPILQSRPQAEARVRGSDKYPNISGSVKFYRTKLGTLIYAEIGGLPAGEGICGGRIFGFHIHEGSGCRGNAEDPFADAMTHYNPGGCAHPYHAGDLPPLFGNNGYALAVFLTNRFDVDEIIGRTVIIHSAPDDFTTQPSGNSGDKIACGEIRRI